MIVLTMSESNRTNLFDNAGREVASLQTDGAAQIQLDVSAWKPGFYFVQCRYQDGSLQNAKLVVQR